MTEPQPHPVLNKPALHLIYASAELPIPSKTTLAARIPPIDDQDAVSIEWVQQDLQRCLGQVRLGEHILLIDGMAAPIPQEVSGQTIMVSPWGAQIKAAMRQNRAHLSLVYGGSHPDPIEQMIAIYRLACAFENEDLLGVVNINAWTAHPPADFLSPHRISQYRQEIPFNLWFGYVRFYLDDDSYWLTTKGHHIFDVPDLAYFVKPNHDEEAVINLFINVFYYLFEEDVVVVPGDTLEIRGSGQRLRFSEVTELTDFLMGPSGTLVITTDSAET
jgi:hypothetical protein